MICFSVIFFIPAEAKGTHQGWLYWLPCQFLFPPSVIKLFYYFHLFLRGSGGAGENCFVPAKGTHQMSSMATTTVFTFYFLFYYYHFLCHQNALFVFR